MATVEISCEPPITQEEVGRTNVNTENMQGDDGNNTEEHQSVEPPMAQEKVCRTNVNSENMQEDDGSNTEEHQSMEPPLTQDKTGHTNVNTENMQGDCDSNIEEDQSVEDTVLYKQSDHLHNISSKLKAFREQGIMCDVEINLGATRMLAHKCVLAAGSSKLNSLLADSAHDVPIKQVNIPTKCPKSFKHLIDYLYTGCLSVSLSNLSELVHLGDALEIPGILSLCCRHLEESLNVENWSTIFHLANALDLDLVLESVKNFAVDYFSFLSSSDDFVELDYNFFKTLISKCNIENDCDLEIFKIKEILQWVSHETDRACHMEDLMEFVNLQNIDPISGLDSVVSLLSLQTHVLENPAYKRFCDNVEMERERTHKNTVVNTDNIYAKQAGVEPANGVRNVKEEDETANGSDIESDAVGVNEDPADCNGEIISSRQKRIRPNLNIRYTDLEAEDASEQKNKRKSFKPKRLRSLYKTKVKGTTGRPRGRPSKKSKPEKKPRMKTSCTQVASANIDEEFEEIAREEREKEEGIECENDEDLPKLETVDQIKLEPEDQKRTQIIQRLAITSKRSRPKVIAREINCQLDDEYGSDTEIEEEYIAEPLMPKRRRSRKALTEKEKYPCPLCSKRFSWKHHVARHLVTHENQKKRAALKLRQKSDPMFGITEEEMFSCMKCPRKFLTRGALSHHMRGHGASAPLLCEICGFSTLHFATMNIHRRIHDASLQYKCSWPGCAYSTVRKSRLNDHINSHSGIKNHVCSTCGKAYTGRKHLNRHEQSHNKDKLVKCEECNYETSRRDKLRDHIKRHHPGTAIIRGFMHPDDLNKPKPPPRKRPPRVRKPRPPKRPKSPAPETNKNVIVERVFKEESIPSNYLDVENKNAVLHIADDSSERGQSPRQVPTPTARERDGSLPVYHVPTHHLVPAGAISEDVLHLLHSGVQAQGFAVPGQNPGASGAVTAGAINLATSSSQGQYNLSSNSHSDQQWYVMQYSQQQQQPQQQH